MDFAAEVPTRMVQELGPVGVPVVVVEEYEVMAGGLEAVD